MARPQVDQALVHADAAHHPVAAAANQHLGAVREQPWVAVGVAGGQGGDHGGGGGAMGVAVGDAGAGGHPLQVSQARGQFHDGLHRHRARQVAARIVAVGDHAQAYHVQVRLRQADDGARVGGVVGQRAAVGDGGDRRVEGGELCARELLVRLAGAGEVGAQAGEAQAGHAAQLCGDRRRLLRAAADARHAGVDLQVHVDGAPRRRRGARQVASHGGVPAQRREPGRRDRGRLLGQRQAEQQDRRLDAGLAQFHPLVDGGHAERADAGLQGGARHRHGAVAVRVGLDRQADPRRRPRVAARGAQVGGHRRQVGAQAGQVDGGARRSHGRAPSVPKAPAGTGRAGRRGAGRRAIATGG